MRLVDRHGNNFLTISSSEQNTGVKWIDGKTIYTKTVHKSFADTNGLNQMIEFSTIGITYSNISNIWIDESNSFVKYSQNGSYWGTQSVNTYASTSVSVNDFKACYLNDHAIVVRSYTQSNLGTDWYITLKYTKK